MKIVVKKDDDGFLAEVENTNNLYAFGYSEKEAKEELLNVIEMMIDYHTEQIKIEKKAQKKLKTFS